MKPVAVDSDAETTGDFGICYCEPDSPATVILGLLVGGQ